MRFSTPVSCNPSCCQADVHEEDAWRMVGRNPVGNVRGWTEFLVAMLENLASVAAFVHVKREPLPSKTASTGCCCEHLVTTDNDKSCCFWQVFIQCCCLMLLLHVLHQLRVPGTVNASTAPCLVISSCTFISEKNSQPLGGWIIVGILLCCCLRNEVVRLSGGLNR